MHFSLTTSIPVLAVLVSLLCLTPKYCEVQGYAFGGSRGFFQPMLPGYGSMYGREEVDDDYVRPGNMMFGQGGYGAMFGQGGYGAMFGQGGYGVSSGNPYSSGEFLRSMIAPQPSLHQSFPPSLNSRMAGSDDSDDQQEPMMTGGYNRRTSASQLWNRMFGRNDDSDDQITGSWTGQRAGARSMPGTPARPRSENPLSTLVGLLSALISKLSGQSSSSGSQVSDFKAKQPSLSLPQVLVPTGLEPTSLMQANTAPYSDVNLNLDVDDDVRPQGGFPLRQWQCDQQGGVCAYQCESQSDTVSSVDCGMGPMGPLFCCDQ